MCNIFHLSPQYLTIFRIPLSALYLMVVPNSLKYAVSYGVPYLFHLSLIYPYVCNSVASHDVGSFIKSHI